MADNIYEDVAQLFHVTAARVVIEMLDRHYQFPEARFNAVCAQMKTANTWKPFLADTYRNFSGRGWVLRKQDEPTSPEYRPRLVYEWNEFAAHELWRFVDIFIDHLENTPAFAGIDPGVRTVIDDLLIRVKQPLPLDTVWHCSSLSPYGLHIRPTEVCHRWSVGLVLWLGAAMSQYFTCNFTHTFTYLFRVIVDM